MNEFPIITKLGGRDAVYELLKDRLNLRTPHALRMWKARGRIPGDPTRELWRAALDAGVECGPEDFEIRGNGEAA